jgi:hypothetical protein
LVFQSDRAWSSEIMVLLGKYLDHVHFGLDQLQAKCLRYENQSVVMIELVFLVRCI